MSLSSTVKCHDTLRATASLPRMYRLCAAASAPGPELSVLWMVSVVGRIRVPGRVGKPDGKRSTTMPRGLADAAPIARRGPAFDLTSIFGASLSKASSFDGQRNRLNEFTNAVCKIGADEMLAILDHGKTRGRENTVKYFDASLRGEWSGCRVRVTTGYPATLAERTSLTSAI